MSSVWVCCVCLSIVVMVISDEHQQGWVTRHRLDELKKLRCLQEVSLQHRRWHMMSPASQQQEANAVAQQWLSTQPTLQAQLYRHQHPADCSKARLLLVPYHEPEVCAHACQVHYLVAALSYALEQERVLVLDDSSYWRLRGSRGGDDFFRDYVEPLSSCTLYDSLPLPSSVSSQSRVTAWTGQPPPLNLPTALRQQANPLSLAEWQAQLSYYVLRPLPLTWQLLTLSQGELCLERFRPVVGLHLYWPEVDESYDTLSLSDYLDAADQLAIQQQWGQLASNLLVVTRYEQDEKHLQSQQRRRSILSLTRSYWHDHLQEIHTMTLLQLFALLQADGLILHKDSPYAQLVLDWRRATGRNLPVQSIGWIV